MFKLSQKLLIFILLACLSLAVSGCLVKPQTPVSENQNTNTATTTEEIDTSDWKTYQSEEYGFEFKYPGEWHLDVCNKEDGIDEVIVILLDDIVTCTGNLPDSKISASLGESYNILNDRQIFNLIDYQEEKITIGDNRFIKISGDLPYKDAEGNIIPNTWVRIIDTSIMIPEKDRYIVLRFHVGYGLKGLPILEEDIKVYNDLVESFRFIQ